MTLQERSTRGWALALVGAAGIVLGIGATLWWTSRRTTSPARVPQAAQASTTLAGPVTISLALDVLARAGISTEVVQTRSMAMHVHMPGRVEPNAYGQTTIQAVTPGRISAWSAQLGTNVTAGQVLGQLYAPEVAEQERVLLAMRAELEAAHAKLLRTEELVGLGSVSQQELETVRAEHVRHETDIEGARARLRLLGLSANQIAQLTQPSEISAFIDIVSPQSGVVTRRPLNVGQSVETGTELITVADLSTVWIVADAFERDSPLIHVGDLLRVASAAFDGERQTRVSYVDPQVTPETRTVRVRADLPNPDGRLRLGMYVDVDLTTAQSSSGPVVPKAAIQTIGDRQVVYVAVSSTAGKFVEREVRPGAATGDVVQILDGLAAGESVVVEGAFFLRAERDRLGLGR